MSKTKTPATARLVNVPAIVGESDGGTGFCLIGLPPVLTALVGPCQWDPAATILVFDTAGTSYYHHTDQLRQTATDIETIHEEKGLAVAYRQLADALDAWEEPA